MLALIGYHAADAVVRALPPQAAHALGVGVARLAYALPLPARRAVTRNLARLRHGVTPASGREAFEHFARSLVDFLRLGSIDRATLAAAIDVRGGEHLAAAEASGRGVIVLSAHLGNWEWGAAFLGGRSPRLHLIARPHADPRVDAFFGALRARWGVTSLPGRPLWVRAAQALRRREWVAIMGDRSVPGASSACSWAAALARRTGALVLPAVMVRLADGRYAACFEPPLSPELCAAGGYRSVMQGYLERYPGQWAAFEAVPEGLA